ncbi:MAG: T9SS type A sorting domain-containing protein [Calditrichia bacterium]
MNTNRNFLLLLAVWLVLQGLTASALFAGGDFYQNARQIKNQLFEGPDHKCGFPVVLEASNPQNKWLHREFKAWQALQVEWNTFYVSPSGHFKIYYDTLGYRAVPDYDRNHDGFPDYVDFVAKSFDRAWQVEIDSLGFNPPPDVEGNPRQVYPVYCQPLSVYGSTILDSVISETFNPHRVRYETNIQISTYFDAQYPGISDPVVRDSMAIAVTAAHEFNHALQVGYALWPDNSGFFYDIWFIESSATYMEEVVADGVNDYLQYLPSYFRATDEPLDRSTGGLSDYGKVVIEIMLGKMYGKDITRRIWTQIRNQRALPAVETVLDGLGSDIFAELSRLCGWLFFVGDRSVGNKFFPDAPFFASYGDIDFRTGEPLQATRNELIADSLPRLSFRWYKSDVADTIPMSFLLRAGEGGYPQNLSSLYINAGQSDYFNVNSTVNFRYPDKLLPQGIYYSVVNGTDAGEGKFYYQLLAEPEHFVKADDVIVYPQPFRLADSQNTIKFENIPKGSEIYIFSSNGRYLQTLRNDSGINTEQWDLKTHLGEVVGSGVYVYIIKSKDFEKKGKLVVIR